MRTWVESLQVVIEADETLAANLDPPMTPLLNRLERLIKSLHYASWATPVTGVGENRKADSEPCGYRLNAETYAVEFQRKPMRVCFGKN